MSLWTPFKRWIGFGVKSGGQLLIGGVESTTAHMVNLGNGETFELQIISRRWGLGLGGGGGVVCVLGFGFIEPYFLHRQSLNDWGFNIAITKKLISKSVMQSIAFSKPMYEAYKGYKKNRHLMQMKHAGKAIDDAGFLASLRNLLHTLYAGIESSKREGIVVLELPADVGLEASVFLSQGTIYVSNSSDWMGPQ